MRNGDWCVNWDLGERIASKYKQQFEYYVLTDGLKIKKKKKYTFMSLLLSFIVTEAQTNNDLEAIGMFSAFLYLTFDICPRVFLLFF